MRYLQSHIIKDLQKKMVFVGGPRQCGKTTLAQQILSENLLKNRKGLYLNWDNTDQRESILKKQWDDDHKLIVLDEVHKFPRWKNWLKGVYDTQKEQHSFLVTGSARLDVYRRGGDSMFGRYHYWRLHPFTLSELPVKMKPAEAYRRLMTVGGFPEPFLDGDETAARRWRRERFDRILRDDIRDLEPLRDIPTLSLFVEQLRRRVGGMIVLSNLANELQVAPKTVKHWLTILEKMYLVFVVAPLTQNISRAVLKPPKVYFFDNADVIGDEGARFENLVATHLLKRLNFLEDRDGYRYELRFIRDKEGREVDFAIVRDGVVIELIEAKLSDNKVSTSLRYYSERLNPEQSLQIVGHTPHSYKQGKLKITSALEAFIETLK